MAHMIKCIRGDYMTALETKQKALQNRIRNLGSAAVAFSAGVDSTFLLKAVHDILADNCIAITIKLHSTPQKEISEAISFCKAEKIHHIIIDFNELEIKGFCENPANRCYICKKAFFLKIKEIAAKNGISNILEGSNTDDNNDYRPGMQAIAELKIQSPLKDAGLSKGDIRTLSETIGLKTYAKPSFACLASRFAYGEKITPEKLEMVEKAEKLLFSLGLTQARVRISGSSARIEVLPDEFDKIMLNRQEINDCLKALGFIYVSLDLGGYKTGNMNQQI